MDIQNQVENEKFLMVFGSPFKSMCSLITLKSGIIIIGVLDIIMGILNFIGVIGLVILMINYRVDYILSPIDLSLGCVGVIPVPFALIGIRGINRISPGDISLYSKFKIVEMFVLIILTLVETIAKCLVEREDLVISLVFWMIIRIIAGCLVKVVWSTDIRLKYNDTVLVMHGEAALKLMQQQSANLANPQVITPGMPIYISPTFEKV